MPRIDLMRFLLCSATVSLAWLSIGRPAQSCPEGMYSIGDSSVMGCAPIPGVPQPGDPQYGGGNFNSESSQPSDPIKRPDPEQSALELGVAFALVDFRETTRRFELLATAKKNLLDDPKYRAYYDGSWDFFQNKNNAPGGSCGALFSKIDGLILLTGPDKNYPGVLLTFWGKNIPRPKEAEKIKVALTQDNDPPQTVQALNYVAPGIEYGAITFAVPTVEAALAEIKDVTSFDLGIEGKSVLKIKWNGGLAVRDKFRECEMARVKK